MKEKPEMAQYIAEFIGTFFLVFFGCGAVILAETNQAAIAGSAIPFVFGGTVAIMIYATGHISGAHFNPAVTIAFWVAKKFPGKKIPGYLFAQFSGGLFASLLHLLIWGKGHSFGATTINLNLTSALVIEFILSFALMFVIIAVATDSRAVGELAGIAIGTTVAICAFVGGPLTGASMNPARSFAPAVLSGELSHLWVYLIVPILGTSVGAFVYDRIRCHVPEDDSKHGCC